MSTITKQVQFPVSGSQEFKAFITSCRESYGAAGTTKEYNAISEREVSDAILEFISANRMERINCLVTDDDGNEIEEMQETGIDLFELEINRTLALRTTQTRQNTATIKLASAQSEIEALKAQLAAMLNAQVGSY